MEGETYFGVKIFRFYIKCTRCSSEITFKTDPKNTDYSVEHGAQRNFEPWRESDAITQETEEERLNRLEEEEREEEENGPTGTGGDAMSALESRTIDSKREMDILDKLQEIRGRNARLERANPDEVLERISSRRDPTLMDEEERQAELQRLQEEEEDEELVKKYFARGVVEPPSIELEGEEAEGAVGDAEGLGEGSSSSQFVNGEDQESHPVAGPSGTSGTSDSSEFKAPTPATNGKNGTSVVKRKLVDVEPDAVSLLSEEARKIVGSTSFKAPPLPPKKKKANGSSLLGIKLKSK